MKETTILVGAYVGYTILQMYVVKNYILDWKSLLSGDNIEQMTYNLAHKSELNQVLSKEITSRMKMLEEIDYEDWIAYNNKNSVIVHNNYEYDLFLYERSVNDMANYLSNSHYILRANRDVDKLGLSNTDLIRQANYSFLFSLFMPNPDLLETIYKGSRYSDNTNIFSYFTADSQTVRAVKSNAITGVWKKIASGQDVKDNKHMFEGVILIGYNLIDVEDQYSNKYYNFVQKPFLFLISLGTIITTLILFHSSGQNNFWMSLLFLSITNIYLMVFLNTSEGITTLPVENDKMKDINDGILSISFLAAVNIYILQSLKAVRDHNNLHNESAFLFTLALALLLFALYKKTNYNQINDIRVHRIRKQFMYNLSIFVNLFILFNYLVYVARDGSIMKTLKQYLMKTIKY